MKRVAPKDSAHKTNRADGRGGGPPRTRGGRVRAGRAGHRPPAPRDRLASSRWWAKEIIRRLEAEIKVAEDMAPSASLKGTVLALSGHEDLVERAVAEIMYSVRLDEALGAYRTANSAIGGIVVAVRTLRARLRAARAW